MPDRGYHQGQPRGTWVATAAIVVEIISPDDETYEKFGFYAACGVKEIFLADPSARSFTISGLTPNGTYEEAARSALLEIGAADLAAAISWPEETPS